MPLVRLGNARQVNIGANGLVLCVHFQNLFTPAHVGGVHHDLAIEAARTQQRRVKHVNAVGSGNQHHGVVFLEAVHFHEQLVQGLLAFVMATAKARTTLAAHGVNFVNEDNRRSGFLGVFEQVAHTACAYAHEHFNELRTGNAEERHLGLARNGARQQGLARTRGAHQQAAARNFRTQRTVLVGIHQEVFDFLEFFDRFIFACHIGEGDIGAFFDIFFCLRLAKRHLRIVGLAHLAEEENHETGNEQDGQDAAQDIPEAIGNLDLVLNVRVACQKPA